MNVDHVLDTLNREGVNYLLIGGMNFLLRHKPIVTLDIDLWIEDEPANRRRCEIALAALDAEWGAGDSDWNAVALLPSGWLSQQGVFCLNCPHGAIDIFRSVEGLDDWKESHSRSVIGKTSEGVDFRGLSDADMLKCQYALETPYRKLDRIAVLESAILREDQQA